MTVYQDDLQKSAGFSEIFKHKQSIEFRFKDTIFILSENCLSRQSLDKKPQTLCQSDYRWFLSSMTIYFLGNKVRAEALQQGLSRQNDAAFSKIIQEICLINFNQQDARQLMGMDRLENFDERELENFIFNSKYVRDTYLSTFHGGNSSNLVSRINQAVRRKITDLKLESEESNAFTSLNRDNYSRPLPETQSAIFEVLQTDINTPSSISHRAAEGFNWMPSNKRIEQMESLLYEKEQRNLPTLDRRLTFQERKCLHLASQGKEIKEAANILGLSQRTIKYHRANIIKKLDVPNLMAAIGRGNQYCNTNKDDFYETILNIMDCNVYEK